MLKLESKISLSRFTTLKIGGAAQNFCEPTSIDELSECLNNLASSQEPFFILGGGSNLLISSEGFNGTVIRTTKLTNITLEGDDCIIAQAGVRLPHLSRYAANANLSGLEFSCGIPGTVGGAVVMNAGAHGSSMSNLIESVTIFDTKDGKIKTLSASELDFKYRKCNLNPHNQTVLYARLKLTNGNRDDILTRIKANEDYRWKSQPLSYPNAGSTFKNPSFDKQAGKLLDLSGAKSLNFGQAAVSAIHANFVINLGSASSSEVVTLMKKMQDSVYKQFDIKLSPEWKILGHFKESLTELWG